MVYSEKTPSYAYVLLAEFPSLHINVAGNPSLLVYLSRNYFYAHKSQYKIYMYVYYTHTHTYNFTPFVFPQITYSTNFSALFLLLSNIYTFTVYMYNLWYWPTNDKHLGLRGI